MTFSLAVDTGSTFAGLQRSTYRGWTIVEIPKGYRFYKSMPRTRTTVKNPENPYSEGSAWFSSKPVADLYTEQENREHRNHLTYEFTVLKPLRLLYLPDLDNLDRLLQSGTRNDELFEAFRATTGAGLTFQKQVDWWKHMLGSRFSQNLKVLRKPDTVPILTEGDVKTGTGFHRVSLRTYIDRKMLAYICRETNLDGYICPNVPTFIVMKDYPMPYIHEEVALCIQKKNIEIQVADIIPDFLGFTSAIKKDRSSHTITKYYFNTEKSIETIERELVASKIIEQSNLAAEFATLTDFRRTGDHWLATGDLYTTDLLSYFKKNSDRLSLRTIKTILNKILKDSNTLNEIGILHYDLQLNNCFLKSRKIHIGDFGSSYVKAYQYKHNSPPAAFDKYLRGKLDQKALLTDVLLFAAGQQSETWKDLFTELKDRFQIRLPAQLLRMKTYERMQSWFNTNMRSFSNFYAKIPNSAVDYFKV